MLTTIDRGPSRLMQGLHLAASSFGLRADTIATENAQSYVLRKPVLRASEEEQIDVAGDWLEFQKAIGYLQNPHYSFKPIDNIKLQAARIGLYKASLIHDKAPGAEILLPYDVIYGIGLFSQFALEGDNGVVLDTSSWIPPSSRELGKEGSFPLVLQPPQGKTHFYTVQYTAENLYP